MGWSESDFGLLLCVGGWLGMAFTWAVCLIMDGLEDLRARRNQSPKRGGRHGQNVLCMPEVHGGDRTHRGSDREPRHMPALREGPLR